MGRAGFGEECRVPGEEPVGGAGKRWDGKNRVWKTSEPWRRYCWWYGEKVGWEEQCLGRNIRSLEKILLVVRGKGGMRRAGFGEEHQNPGEEPACGAGKRWDGKSRVQKGMSGPWSGACWGCREKGGWEEQGLGKNIRALEKIPLVAWREGGMGRGA